MCDVCTPFVGCVDCKGFVPQRFSACRVGANLHFLSVPALVGQYTEPRNVLDTTLAKGSWTRKSWNPKPCRLVDNYQSRDNPRFEILAVANQGYQCRKSMVDRNFAGYLPPS